MKFITALFLFFIPLVSNAQVFLLSQNDSIASCTGLLYDSGNDQADYSNNENYEYTICPNAVGLKAEITFQGFILGAGDELCIYDGDNASTDPLIGCYGTGQNIVGTTFTSNEGCLTLVFTSDGSGTAPGFVAELGCANCQKIDPMVSTTPGYDTVSGFLDICPGDTIHFESITEYPENSMFYTQHDTSSVFKYVVGGVAYNTSAFDHSFSSGGYYPLIMEVTDVSGCKTRQEVLLIRVAGAPVFAGTGIDVLNTLCVGDTLSLYGAYDTDSISYFYGNSGEPFFLPDGFGGSYSGSSEISTFSEGQAITSTNDLVSICINMEHSYLGDLEISIVCPDGSSVILKNFPGGGGTFLGGAIDEAFGSAIPGIGFDYCFEISNANGTMDEYAAANSSDTLPAGTYESYEDFSDLVGCPLNGEWQIVITDSLAVDNGFVFGWSLNFASYLYNDTIGFQTHIVSSTWQNPGGDNIGVDTLIYNIVQNGANPFVFSVIDDFGCAWDTTITINAAPSPITNFSADNECTNTQPFTFNNTSSGSIASYSWDFGDGTTSTQPSPTHTYDNVGTYSVHLALVSNAGCQDDTTISVVLFETPTAAFDESVEIRCDSVILSYTNNSTTSPQYRWLLNGELYSTQEDISVTLPFEAIYSIQLQVINGVCNRSTAMLDTLGSFWDYYSLKIPNVFTPNEDGKNDVYSIKDGFILSACTKYEIYNRWGKLIFESSPERPIWNGKDKDGTVYADGTYVYIITFKGKKYSGEFTLLK